MAASDGSQKKKIGLFELIEKETTTGPAECSREVEK